MGPCIGINADIGILVVLGGRVMAFPRYCSVIVFLAFAASGSSFQAMAADGQFFDPGSIYIRGDAGVALGRDDTGVIGDLISPDDTVDFDFGKSPSFGLGVGFYVNDYIRTDVTAQYMTRFDLTGLYTNDGLFLPNSTPSVVLDSATIMLSGYLEVRPLLGEIGPFNPYIGGGIGISRNKLGTFSVSDPTVGTSTISGDTDIDLAWKITAGTGIKLTGSVMLDLSYSYLDLGGASSSRSAVDDGVSGQLREPLRFDVRMHTLMLGVRYFF